VRHHAKMAPTLLPLLRADAKPFQLVEAIDPLRVHLPALPPKQHMQPPVPESLSCLGEFAHPHPQRGLVLRLALPIERRPAQPDELAGPQPADAEGAHEPGGALAQRRGP